MSCPRWWPSWISVEDPREMNEMNEMLSYFKLLVKN